MPPAFAPRSHAEYMALNAEAKGEPEIFIKDWRDL